MSQMPSSPTWVVVLVFAALCGPPCCSPDEPQCRVGADCASGVCLSSGTCQPVADDGGVGPADDPGGSGEEHGAHDDGIEEADPGPADEQRTDAQPGCRPNRDGLLERSEVPLKAGLRATFLVGRQATVDTSGQVEPDGSRIWDLSGELAGDHLVLAELQSLEGRWFAPAFSQGTYAARLVDGQDLLGVYRVTDEALLLLGVVSPEGGLLRTELTYDPPVTVLSFPLEMDKSWSNESTVSGLASGVYSLYTELYQSQVDADGEILVPFGSFAVLRVRVELTRTVGMMVTRLRSFAFVTECFGTVATVHSAENEPAEEFTLAAEAWRLAP